MSKLARLQGKPLEVEIAGEKFNIKPLKVKDMDLIMKAAKEETRGEAIHQLISKTLKESVPDATDEEVEGVAVEHFEELMTAIAKVNNLPMDDLKKLKEQKIKDVKLS